MARHYPITKLTLEQIALAMEAHEQGQFGTRSPAVSA